MSVDWFTVIAQAINFIILLWLMKLFLFKPIIKAIDEREKRIAASLALAEEKMNTAQDQKDLYDKKKEDLVQQSSALLKTAEQEANSEKKRILQQARDQAEILTEKRRQDFIAEELSIREGVRKRTVKEVLAITRNVLTDLAGTSLEQQIIKIFTERLHNLDADKKEELSLEMKKEAVTVSVKTAFPVDSTLQSTISNGIHDIFNAQPLIRFETDSEVISGIELGVNGQKIAWSVVDYLSSMGKGIDDLLQVKQV